MDNSPKIEFVVKDPRVGREFPPPQYATGGSAGMDLIACIDAERELKPGEAALFGTGVALWIADKNYVGIVASRSGLSIKRGIMLANGVGIIDSDYQGELRVALRNHSAASYTIAPGERIAQIMLMPVASARLVRMPYFSCKTARAEGGFGSTGRK